MVEWVSWELEFQECRGMAGKVLDAAAGRWTYEDAGQLVGAGWVSGTRAVQCAGDDCTCFCSLSAEGQKILLLSLHLQSSQSGWFRPSHSQVYA